jgi:carbonic anhydrase/acetyltransferase-like protein (isoleucine patch superfamily)
VQDNSVIHVGEGVCEIGAGATIGHLCLVHHCVIGAEALVGNGSIVLDGAVVGPRALIAAGSTVTPGTEVPGETVAVGSPAKKFVPLEGTAKLWVDHNERIYRELAKRHKDGVEPV